MRVRLTVRALALLALFALSAVAASAQSLTCAIVFDGSKSLGPGFADAKQAAREFVGKMAAGDSCMVARFVSSDEIRVIQDFTGDRAALLAALDKLHTDEGQSAVVDAVYVAVAEVAKQKPPRALILITDGEDRASYYKPERLFEELRASGVRVYAVGLTGGLKGGARRKAEKLLKQIAEASGGRAFIVVSSAELTGIVAEIAEAARRE